VVGEDRGSRFGARAKTPISTHLLFSAVPGEFQTRIKQPAIIVALIIALPPRNNIEQYAESVFAVEGCGCLFLTPNKRMLVFSYGSLLGIPLRGAAVNSFLD
jgi:hypothetical protein